MSFSLLSDTFTTYIIKKENMKYRINRKHEKETQKYIKDVLKKLSVNGNIPDDWSGSITLLEDNYDVFIKCTKILEKEGITIKDRFGSQIAHPTLKIKNDAQIQIQKLNIEFGLTKKSSQKIVEVIEEEDSPLLKFVKGKNKIEKR